MYFIKLEGENNSSQIINKITTTDTYKQDFQIIYKHLNKEGEYFYEMSEYKMNIMKHENVVKKGYIYNSKQNVIKKMFVLSLIKINDELSDLFKINYCNQSIQTEYISTISTTSTTQTVEPEFHSIVTQTPTIDNIEQSSQYISSLTNSIPTQTAEIETDYSYNYPSQHFTSHDVLIDIEPSPIIAPIPQKINTNPFINNTYPSLTTQYQQFQDSYDFNFNSYDTFNWCNTNIGKLTPPPPPPRPAVEKPVSTSQNPFTYFSTDFLLEFTSELKNKLVQPNFGLNSVSENQNIYNEDIDFLV